MTTGELRLERLEAGTSDAHRGSESPAIAGPTAMSATPALNGYERNARSMFRRRYRRGAEGLAGLNRRGVDGRPKERPGETLRAGL